MAMTSSTRSSETLLDAAVALIAASGLDNLTLSAVAERAGVSRATAYREFGDKDGLISAVGRSEIGRMAAAAYREIDVFAPAAEVARACTLFALRYLRKHAAFSYIRRHEPARLLDVAITHGDSELNLVETVAAIAAPVIAARDDSTLRLSPTQAAEVVVRTVLSHALIERSELTDEQIADTVARAITR
ncbi:TetR/AcrR family transcriptional regulator [Nocardia abscessus]|uniref:TetR/AcrR family transcriptional regulator n=1 Tax=Nocardia abscessus TaxID=120957 RepID=UPI002458E2E2|nr:helix-turn-helix domain-containing protein [Nocardia abscessus]